MVETPCTAFRPSGRVALWCLAGRCSSRPGLLVRPCTCAGAPPTRAGPGHACDGSCRSRSTPPRRGDGRGPARGDLAVAGADGKGRGGPLQIDWLGQALRSPSRAERRADPAPIPDLPTGDVIPVAACPGWPVALAEPNVPAHRGHQEASSDQSWGSTRPARRPPGWWLASAARPPAAHQGLLPRSTQELLRSGPSSAIQRRAEALRHSGAPGAISAALVPGGPAPRGRPPPDSRRRLVE